MGNTAIIQGHINPDGTLELDETVPLPPGPVQVTLETVVDGPEDLLVVLERIHRRREARGAQGRTAEEIDRDIQAMRDEWDSPMDISSPTAGIPGTD